MFEPLADCHRLEETCSLHGITLTHAHQAMSDVLGTAALVRVLLERGFAPESAQLDHNAFMRLRTRGDTRPASEPQVRRVFALARPAGLAGPDGYVDSVLVSELVHRVTGVDEADLLTREQIQNVYDELERLIEAQKHRVDTEVA